MLVQQSGECWEPLLSSPVEKLGSEKGTRILLKPPESLGGLLPALGKVWPGCVCVCVFWGTLLQYFSLLLPRGPAANTASLRDSSLKRSSGLPGPPDSLL